MHSYENTYELSSPPPLLSENSFNRNMSYSPQNKSFDASTVSSEFSDSGAGRSAQQSIFFGWLWKRGSSIRNWKKRFFVLRNCNLSYYEHCTILPSQKEKKGLRFMKSPPKGALHVASVSLSKKSEFGLCVTSTTNRHLYVQAPSEEARKQWLEAMEKAIEKSKLCDFLASTTDSIYSISSDELVGSPDSFPVINEEGGVAMSPGCFRDSPTFPRKEGWLKKQGRIYHSWKKRYFVLRNGLISYKVDDNEDTKPIKTDGITKVSPWTGKQFGLCVKLNSGRDLYLDTGSEEMQQDWFHAFDKVVSINYDMQSRTQ